MKIQEKQKTQTQTWKKWEKIRKTILYKNVILRKNIVNIVMGRSFWQKELEQLSRALPRKGAAESKFRRRVGRDRSGRSKKDVDRRFFFFEGTGGYLNDEFVKCGKSWVWKIVVDKLPSKETWLILPVVICLSQRLSHACLSISFNTVKLQKAH